jgi:hypothetical protein
MVRKGKWGHVGGHMDNVGGHVLGVVMYMIL